MTNKIIVAGIFVLMLIASCDSLIPRFLQEDLTVYERITFNMVAVYLNISGGWDCSNLSWAVMKSFQAEGFDAWYCAGFVRNQTDEAHAWVVIRGNNTFTRINPSEWYLQVAIPDEEYLRDYRMVRCSNETYFDWVPVDPEREYW